MNIKNLLRSKKTRIFLTEGYTLVEVIIAVAVFFVVATAVYDGYVSLLKMITSTRVKTSAIALANEQLEIIHNLPYDSVGLVSGVPSGVLPRFASTTRSKIPFLVRLSIQDIDDPFDGQIGSTTKNDLSPNDYKRVEVEISCSSCRDFTPFVATSFISPKNLENNSGNGALFVKVIDANGQAVSEADVRIILASTTKTVNIAETTDLAGLFQLVNTYPANLAYQISVSKAGYSSARTYAIGESGIVNPVQPNATVVAGKVTQVTLAIDRLSQIDLKTLSPICQPIANVPVLLTGAKLLGTNPEIPKINSTVYTNSLGTKTISDAEWDTYNLNVNLAGYVLAGSLPLQSLVVAPGSINKVSMILTPNRPLGLLVSVKDMATGLPLSDSNVSLSSGTFSLSKISNRGFWSQTDWSGGGGQSLWSDESRYANSADITTDNPNGEIKLRRILDQYVSSGWLESSVFDTGSASSTYYQVGWLPLSQASTTGYGNVLAQLATGDDPATTTWNYLGPDGTNLTFYSATTTAISPVANNHRYLRYKLFFHTLDFLTTPIITDFRVTYSSECLPFGQVYFDSLSAGTYNLDVTRDGYLPVSQTLPINSNWQSREIQLSPQ